MLKKLFNWVFKKELAELDSKIAECKNATQNCKIQTGYVLNLLDNIDISVDVHEYSSSWACISIQGKSADYIKFVNLGNADILEIKRFMSQFERSKVDCTPHQSQYLRISNTTHRRGGF